MNQTKKEEIYKALVETYGEENQCMMCIEEMSELTKELLKFERGYDGRDQYDRIAEEIADVLITVEQVIRIYGIEDDVNCWVERKLIRTRDKLREH